MIVSTMDRKEDRLLRIDDCNGFSYLLKISGTPYIIRQFLLFRTYPGCLTIRKAGNIINNLENPSF